MQAHTQYIAQGITEILILLFLLEYPGVEKGCNLAIWLTGKSGKMGTRGKGSLYLCAERTTIDNRVVTTLVMPNVFPLALKPWTLDVKGSFFTPQDAFISLFSDMKIIADVVFQNPVIIQVVWKLVYPM